MTWNEIPYWLKGGIILVVICIITITVIQMSLGYLGDGNFDCWKGFMSDYKCNFLDMLVDPVVWFTVLVYSVPSLLLGFLFGWIYGKLKSEK